MSRAVQIPGFENKKIELGGTWTQKLVVDGQDARPGKEKLEFLVADDKGEERSLFLKSQALDLPTVEFNGETFLFAKPVATSAKIFLAILLIPLMLVGGAVGGGLAGAGFMLGDMVIPVGKNSAKSRPV